MYNLSQKKIWVAGHNGMVGKAVVRKLSSYDCEIICANKKDLNLLDQKAVQSWMKRNKPDAVIICAAKVGGILANSSYPADFLYNNLMIETNIIHAAHLNEVEKLLFLGSSCIYPREANQPIIENSLLTGALEPTNEWYAIAKIAGIKLCRVPFLLYFLNVQEYADFVFYLFIFGFFVAFEQIILLAVSFAK